MKLRKKHLGKRKVVIETASKLYKRLNIYATLYDKLSEDSKKRVDVLNRPEILNFNFNKDDLPQEGDEEVKLEPEETIAETMKLNSRKITGTWLEILTPNKLLTRLPILLVQVKAEKSLSELKNEMRLILYIVYKHNKITKKVYNNLIKSLQSWRKIWL